MSEPAPFATAPTSAFSPPPAVPAAGAGAGVGAGACAAEAPATAEAPAPAAEVRAAEPAPAVDISGLTPEQRGRLLLMLRAGLDPAGRGDRPARPALVEAFSAPAPLLAAAVAAARGDPVAGFEEAARLCDLSGSCCDPGRYDGRTQPGNFADVYAEFREAIGPAPPGFVSVADLSPAERGELLLRLWEQQGPKAGGDLAAVLAFGLSQLALSARSPDRAGRIGAAIAAARRYVDYWEGRPIKSDLSGWHCSPHVYDRDSSPGNFARVYAEFRAELGRPAPPR
jgi:hypothetical protein